MDVRWAEELRQMFRFGFEWMEIVLLRSKFGADEGSVLSWNVSPSGSLCQKKCLQSRVQPSPGSVVTMMPNWALDEHSCRNSMGGMSLQSLRFPGHGLRGDLDLLGVWKGTRSQWQGSLP